MGKSKRHKSKAIFRFDATAISLSLLMGSIIRIESFSMKLKQFGVLKRR